VDVSPVLAHMVHIGQRFLKLIFKPHIKICTQIIVVEHSQVWRRCVYLHLAENSFAILKTHVWASLVVFQLLWLTRHPVTHFTSLVAELHSIRKNISHSFLLRCLSTRLN